MDGEDLGLIDGSGTEEAEIESGEETFVEGEESSEGSGTEEESSSGGDRSEEGREEEGEGRRVERADLPLQLRKALRSNPEIAKQFPKLEKQITGALFKANSVDQLGGVQRFREYAETIDAHGGPEGIAQMAADLEQWNSLDKGFETGDPRVIDGWVKDYPEGFKALLGPAIDKMDSLDPAAADRILSPAMWKIFDRTGVLTTLTALEGAIAKLDPEKAKDVASEFGLLKRFFGDVRSLASKSKAADPLAGDRQRLTEKEAEIDERANKEFYGRVRQDVNKQIMDSMNKLIRTELNGSKIKLNLANRLRKETLSELSRIVNTGKGYAERYKAIMGAGDQERAVKFILSAANAKLPQVVKAMIAEFGLKRGAGSGPLGGRREGGSRPGGNGSNVVSGRPKTSEIDFTRTDKSKWLTMLNQPHGEAYRRDGKLAKW